jgi:hypothetical protein
MGWIAFLVSAVVYISTIEPTASFWDCGEFISTASNLLVGHPPGAPFFMILGRFFTIFAPDRASLAVMVNIMSALASAATILFLFWTITHLAKKLVFNNKEAEPWQMWAVMAAGFIGAMAYTFSDTFWFSAVEGEVYGMSSLFTAAVFWAILKWENVADQPHANRYLILIAYLMGLSIGVHLLNLLTIPAIGLVYYFKKFEINRANTIKALLISAAVLIGVLYGIIPGVVTIATWFELMFVNGFGLGYNSGAIFYIILLIAAIVAGLWFTYKYNKVLLNTILTVVTVILIGYSSFAMIVIRSAAKPTMDQNSPDDVFSLKGYLNREQYGDRPLFYGQYYNSPLDPNAEDEEGDPIYIQKNGKYEIAEHKPVYTFDPNTTTVFPRMYSREPRHIQEYKNWGNIKGNPVTITGEDGEQKTIYVPTFGENLRFFFSYQVYHMYFRYFMWNFSGRQNDMQGNGEPNKGNWITGISFIDKMMVGDENLLPAEYKNNRAHNVYFMLPLILGIIGLFYQFSKGKEGRQGFWVVLALFFLTGLAIVIYLNQTPLQPRERDYAYAGSFYAFTIWIGLGVLGVIEFLHKYINNKMAGVAIAAGATFLLVPAVMANQNWDDHDRSHRYVARDLAYNYLNTCEPNSIIFTNGDNDTFPLWYIQEVEHERTDVRVCNLSYLQTDWYIDQMKRKAYESTPVPFALTHDKYATGSRDVVHLIDRMGGKAIDLKQGLDFVASDDPKTKKIPNYPTQVEYFPAKNFTLAVDSLKAMQKGLINTQTAHLFSKNINISLNKQYILKNELMVLDLLVNNNWDRPIYFSTTVGAENYVGLENYFQLEGFAYRIVPIKTIPPDEFNIGRIETEKMYNNVTKKFRWTGFDDKRVYVDENHLRMASNIRSNLARLANALIDENKKDKAAEVLNLIDKKLPSDRVAHNYFSIFTAEAYYKIGNIAKGDAIIKEMAESNLQELKYYKSLGNKWKLYGQEESRRNLLIYGEIYKMAGKYNRADLLKSYDATVEGMMKQFQFFE